MVTNLLTFFVSNAKKEAIKPEHTCICFNCGKIFFINKKLQRHPLKEHLCLVCGNRQVELDEYYKKR